MSSTFLEYLRLDTTKRGCLLDTEYNNINSFFATKMWCASVIDLSTGEKKNFHPKDEGEDQFHDQFGEDLKEYLEGFDFFVAHNLYGAEYYVLKNLIGFTIEPHQGVDTLVLSRLLRPQSPKVELFRKFDAKGWDTRVGMHSLEAWGKRLGYPKLDFDDYERFSWKMLTYCDRDRDVNMLILNQLIKELWDFKIPELPIYIEHEAHRRLCEQRRHGFKLNTSVCNQLYKRTSDLLEEYIGELHTVFPKKKKLIEVYTPKLKKDGTLGLAQKRKLLNNIHEDNGDGTYNIYIMEEFNPGSPKQVGERLMDLGWNPRKFTATSGQPATDKVTIQEAIDHLSKDTPEVEVLRKYGVVQHRNSMSKEWLALAADQKDGRVRGSVNHIGPWTHRCSHFAPNMGNVAKVKLDDTTGKPMLDLAGNFGWESRDCWTVEHGNVLVGADASGVQLRGLAHYMNDPEYIREVCEGDVHLKNAYASGIVTSPEGEKAGRPTAKTFIYAWLLGCGDEKTGLLVGAEPSEYEKLFNDAKLEKKWNRWRNHKGQPIDHKYNNLVWWVYDKLISEDREPDRKTAAIIIKGYFTKKRFLENLPALERFRNEEIKEAAKRGYMVGLDGRKIWIPSEHLAMGAYLQSYEAIIMKYAMILYQDKLDSLGVPYQQVSMVHDEYGVETKPEFAEVVGETIVWGIVEAGKLLGSRCPLAGEHLSGPSWASTH